MAACNYRCIITGDRFDEVHHLVSLNSILKDVLLNNEINVKSDFSVYTKSELDQILSLFLQEQSKYPLGVCLRKDIHKDFHNKYGYGNNTLEQFNDYLINKKCITDPVTITAS